MKTKRARKPLTDEQKRKMRIRSKERYDARKVQGICQYCGKNKAVHGVMCNECRDKHNAKRRGKPLTDAQKARNAQIKKERKKRLESAGLCNICGIKKPDPGLKTCLLCRLYINKSRNVLRIAEVMQKHLS